ncbi:MAG TPA: leucyl aminopeptidase family protein [Arenimonas sp.]|nr:leucyl aminopeptidase family protein [Arenimonas sp.]
MTAINAIDGISTTRENSSIAIVFIQTDRYPAWLADQDEFVRNWLNSQHFQPQAKNFILLPDQLGLAHRVLVLVGEDEPYGIAHLPKLLPKQNYHRCENSNAQLSADNLALGWGLGAYRFDRYTHKNTTAQLHVENASTETLAVLRESLMVRTLINTPTEHMGPEQLEAAVSDAAKEFSAEFTCIKGEALLTENYPTIHAVGRASHRDPRLLRLDWGDAHNPHVVICGKGVCFDTGGLDIKSAVGMRNMKKDMGGAAHALALARLIMSQNLPIRLSLLIPAVENAIAGNAFRPGEVIITRQGLSVEIDNTDAEGRLVLADALCLAGEIKPDLILDFATLTGAARTALGPDLPVLFSNRDEIAESYLKTGIQQYDPLWRLPLFQPYLSYLKSSIADIANSGPSTMAGCISAALFLQRFVPNNIDWVHVDVYSWNDNERPGKPAGGEAQGLRTAFAWLKIKYNL